MNSVLRIPAFGLLGWLALASSAQANYIGFVYPAGAQRGTTVQIRLGGQRLLGVTDAVVTGKGVSAKLVHYYRKLSNQEITLLREQLRDLKRYVGQSTGKSRKWQGKKGKGKAAAKPRNAAKTWAAAKPSVKNPAKIKEAREFIARIEERMAAYCRRPACASLCEIAFVEVTVAPDAKPGRREIRLATSRGMTNPMPFYVGQVPEVARKPMKTSDYQLLGKEYLALRHRPEEEVEAAITLPCTMNGQIASGEVNRYRFKATKGQRLVVSVAARDLVPYIADAVPGWFQPVVAVYDAKGTEVAYNDDFRFKPDPTMLVEVPKDGQYVLEIADALHRGREDFVYRITIGEVPFVTSIFPLGGRAGKKADIEIEGWNLEGAKLSPPAADAQPGTYDLAARRKGVVTNTMPFVLGTLPECFDEESNNDPSHAQGVKLPIVVNGRIDRQDDWDVFEFQGRAGDKIVAEVHARRLDSPLDSMLKLTDADNNLLALNDDHADPGSGLNTHHADSYLLAELPADGKYFVHLGDTARNGGRQYGYRLRISRPRPDFELRVVPSGGGMRPKSSASPTVYVIRKDGFQGDIKLNLKNPPDGFFARPVVLGKGKTTARFGVKTTLRAAEEPFSLSIEGRAIVGDTKIVREAVPAEDRMQAFLWRHLVPAEELSVLVRNPFGKPPVDRTPPPPLDESDRPSAKPAAKTFKFSKKQVAGRLRQLNLLFQEWLLTDEFYQRKVAECEAALD